MADKVTFWKGVSAGLLAGMAIAAALRFTPFGKLLGDLSTVDGTLERSVERPQETLKPADILSPANVNFAFRREPSVSPADQLPPASVRPGAVASFLRSGSSSGSRAVAEVIEIPGDHIDLTKPLRPYPRSLDLGSAG
jgi:hypothetical protein